MNLTKENNKVIAAKLYRNPIIVDSEFYQDLLLINRVVNRVRKFQETGDLKVKMLFNHYKVATNCFGTEYVHKAILLLSEEPLRKMLMTVLWAFSGNEEAVKVNDSLTVPFERKEVIESLAEKIKTELRE